MPTAPPMPEYLLFVAITCLVGVPLNETCRFLLCRALRVPVVGLNLGQGRALTSFPLWGTPVVVRSVPLFWHCRTPFAMDGAGEPVCLLDISAPSDAEREKARTIAPEALARCRGRLIAASLLSPFVTLCLYLAAATAGYRNLVEVRTLSDAPVISRVTEGLAASDTLRVGDRILRVDRVPVSTFAEVVDAYVRHAGERTPMTLTVRRGSGGEERDVSLPPPLAGPVPFAPGLESARPSWRQAALLSGKVLQGIVDGLGP